MTGFGHAEGAVEHFEVSVDIKTVNSRYFDFKPRLPRELSPLESDLRRVVQKTLKRGRIDLYVELNPTDKGQLEINGAVVESYLQVARQLNDMGVGGNLNVYNLMNLPGVLMSRVYSIASGEAVEKFLTIVGEAVDRVDVNRFSEGQSLKADLEARVSSVKSALPEIETRMGKIRELFKAKFEQRFNELSLDLEVDQQRLAQEIVYYIEKADVSEELTRLKSHLQRFEEFISRDLGEPIGKNLDFLCQEMNREANTILSKSPLPEVTDVGVEIKGEIERLREQVQNVE